VIRVSYIAFNNEKNTYDSVLPKSDVDIQWTFKLYKRSRSRGESQGLIVTFQRSLEDKWNIWESYVSRRLWPVKSWLTNLLTLHLRIWHQILNCDQVEWFSLDVVMMLGGWLCVRDVLPLSETAFRCAVQPVVDVPPGYTTPPVKLTRRLVTVASVAPINVLAYLRCLLPIQSYKLVAMASSHNAEAINDDDDDDDDDVSYTHVFYIFLVWTVYMLWVVVSDGQIPIAIGI